MMGTRQCARPGCGGSIAAWLSYDYAGQHVWLDDPTAEPGGHNTGLCATHAGRLRPPLGWSFVDRRTTRPAPEAPAPAAVEPAQATQVAPSAPAADDTAGLAVIAV